VLILSIYKGKILTGIHLTRPAGLFLLLLITSCFNNRNNSQDHYYISSDSTRDTTVQVEEINLPVPIKKLEPYLGKSFQPVTFFITNLDNDINEEFIIAYQQNNASHIWFAVFDLFMGNSLKIKFQYKTAIYNRADFNLQSHNLFFEDDVSIVLEGKSIDNKNLLYIFSYMDDEYTLIGDFSGDYSTLLEFTEKESDKGNYQNLKEVITIDNSFSSTNTNIQQKNVYIWDYTGKVFKLVETSEVLSSQLSSIDRSILKSENNFFSYISGFWYPKDYAAMIESGRIDSTRYNEDTIRFMHFSEFSNQELSIKHGDYVTKYKVVKLFKLWGQKPGLRMKIKDFNNPQTHYNQKIDVYLVEANRIKVSGPKKHQNETFVRLPRPFIEYVNEKKSEKDQDRLNTLLTFMEGSFTDNDNVTVSFKRDASFSILSDTEEASGMFRLTPAEPDILISFFFENDRLFLDKDNYVLGYSPRQQYITLTPARLDLNGIKIDDLNAIMLYKSE
jgi:hypothetical protein